MEKCQLVVLPTNTIIGNDNIIRINSSRWDIAFQYVR